jgi:hypothetical protein
MNLRTSKTKPERGRAPQAQLFGGSPQEGPLGVVAEQGSAYEVVGESVVAYSVQYACVNVFQISNILAR